MAEATISGKNQIVIPRDARKALGLKPGDKLIVVVRDERLIIMQKPKSYSEALKGAARGVYPDGYLEEERGSWE